MRTKAVQSQPGLTFQSKEAVKTGSKQSIKSSQSKEATDEKCSNFVREIESFVENPQRFTQAHHQKLLNYPNTPLGCLEGEGVWKTKIFQIDDLEPYREAISKLTEEVLLSYCPSLEGVLEVGAGCFPVANELLYASDKKRNQIHIADISSRAIQFLREKNPNFNVMELALTQLTNKIPYETYNCIIMRDVLSVLTKDILDKGLKEAAAVLKPGGVLIHMQIKESFTSAITDEYDGNVIVFPKISSTSVHAITKGLYVVPKDELMDRIKTLSNDNPHKKVLSEYLQLCPAEREEFFSIKLISVEGQKALQYLTACLKKLNCPSMKKINVKETFISRTIDGLHKAGLEILKNETIRSEVIVKKKEVHSKRPFSDNPHSHLFSINNGLRAEDYLGVLASGMVQETADVHVIVARKPFQKDSSKVLA